MITTVRAKFRCDSVVGNQALLRAVCDDQNKTWAQYTPCGTLQMSIDNPYALAAFEAGKTYFLDISLAPASEAEEK